jgi:hypothetical protein
MLDVDMSREVLLYMDLFFKTGYSMPHILPKY